MRRFKNIKVMCLIPKQRGGDNMSPQMARETEVERIMNLVRGFGWIKVKDELLGEELHLTVKKPYRLTPEEREAGMPD